MRVLFLIRSLERAGAERQLVDIASGLHRRGHQVTVVTFYPGGALREPLAASGVEVVDLGKSGRWDVRIVPKLSRLVRERKPQILYSWMPAENLLGSLMKMRHRMVLVWGIQTSGLPLHLYDRMSRMLFPLEAMASRWADAIVPNSHAGAEFAVSRGMSPSKIEVVWSGPDCERFRRDAEAGREVRRGWGIPDGRTVVGIVARLDPVKDHATFARAASILASRREDVEFVCIGGADEKPLADLVALARSLGVGERFRWLGPATDMPATYSALDLVALSSVAEGLPNAIAEGMACEVPVAATDVGDCRKLVGDARFIAPPADPAALAEAMERALEAAEAEGLGARLRERVVREFSLAKYLDSTEALLERLLR